jgi:hypothetical protein
MTLIAVLAVVGVLVLLAWPVLTRSRRRRPKRLDQPAVEQGPAPSPNHPGGPGGGPTPGSGPARRRQGKP